MFYCIFIISFSSDKTFVSYSNSIDFEPTGTA
nr:MAG TPA: hypothetical protein [Caudoviricetes sp.]